MIDFRSMAASFAITAMVFAWSYGVLSGGIW